MRGWLIAGGVVSIAAAVWFLNRDTAAIPVQTTRVEHGDVELTVSNTRAGSVKACRRSGLSMPIGGRVEVLHVSEGDQVAAGTLLLELWNDDRKAQKTHAEAQLAAASHRSEQLCVQAEEAQRDAVRKQSLYQRGLTSLELRDAAQTQASAAAFSCEAAHNEVEMAAAALELQRALLAETQLRAPFDGVVAEITGEVGEYVTPSPPGIPTPPAVDLIDYRCLYVTAPIDEVDAGKLSVGQVARISLDAYRGITFAGELTRIAPYVTEIEKQARTVEVDVQFVNVEDRTNLLVGYSADIDVVLTTHTNTLRVATEAVLEGDAVWRVGPDQKLEKVAFEAGLRNWNFTEVVSGLSADDRVLLTLDADGLENGVLVTVLDD